MAGGIHPELARQTSAQVEARGTLDAIGWVGFGWSSTVYLLIAGYYVLRWRLRRFRQSLYIAGLTLGFIAFGCSVVGLASRPVLLVLLLCAALYGTVFLLGLLDELRRGSFRGGQGDNVDSGPQ